MDYQKSYENDKEIDIDHDLTRKVKEKAINVSTKEIGGVGEEAVKATTIAISRPQMEFKGR